MRRALTPQLRLSLHPGEIMPVRELLQARRGSDRSSQAGHPGEGGVREADARVNLEVARDLLTFRTLKSSWPRPPAPERHTGKRAAQQRSSRGHHPARGTRWSDATRFLADPSSAARPDPFRFGLTDGAAVAAGKVPERDAFENPPAGAADCGSTNPKPTPLSVSRKKALFLSTR